MSTAVVEATGLVKTFGRGRAQVRALQSLTILLAPGELTLLMGPSGSGKTTLLSILGCMLTPDAGTVRICGVSAERAGPEERAHIRRKHIGFVFQAYHLFPRLTALQNVQLALDVRGERGGKVRAKCRELLERLGLSDRMNSFPSQMSGGEQQRVAIARALASDPAVVLADEPTAALDTDNGRGILSIFAGIARERGAAVLVVTHDARAVPFAQRILAIEDGALREEAGLSDVVAFPHRQGAPGAHGRELRIAAKFKAEGD
jgi:putative ABC transport system ATP-binding protein